MAAAVLLVEDDPAIATVIGEALREEGYEVTACGELAQRNVLLAEQSFDVLLTDVVLADGDGLSDIASVRERAPDMPIIVLSAQNTLDTAIRASDSDAFEYFPKPFDLDELVRAVGQAVSRRRTDAQEPEPASQSLPFIGRSPAMQGVYRMITRMLRNDLSVLVTGESGTGKELVAEAIHHLGKRSKGPLVAVNAAAIPRDLLESELFGHEKGAFTGAVGQVIGKFEQAHGGTLFLDEIGDMPPEAQTRLLRALQSSRIRRVGGRQEIAVDVRIIAATNRALEPMIAAGTFREDLFYRLNVVPIRLPPLSERLEDIGPLARHFLAQAEAEGLPRRSIDEGAVEELAKRPWRGNVRELRNVVFRLALMARDDTIDVTAVREVDTSQPAADVTDDSGSGFGRSLMQWLEENRPTAGTVYHSAVAAFELPLFEYALAQSGGNQLAAARLLGINRNTLRKRILDLDIDASSFSKRT
ncbi:response regulator [Porphyrobacter algicida]|uniref:DNA-binding transcriptional regulator NtrC n=1 Tax=Qipengyuania algicida TaxID=1836209 RepID=A0A845ADG0_9SPHN|nr:sigma-54 dependent transcriptional regulator [Qipengyuania algicida]MXP28502.1 response regulator [Qipengyuania algicida]